MEFFYSETVVLCWVDFHLNLGIILSLSMLECGEDKFFWIHRFLTRAFLELVKLFCRNLDNDSLGQRWPTLIACGPHFKNSLKIFFWANLWTTPMANFYKLEVGFPFKVVPESSNFFLTQLTWMKNFQQKGDLKTHFILFFTIFHKKKTLMNFPRKN